MVAPPGADWAEKLKGVGSSPDVDQNMEGVLVVGAGAGYLQSPATSEPPNA